MSYPKKAYPTAKVFQKKACTCADRANPSLSTVGDFLGYPTKKAAVAAILALFPVEEEK